MKVCVSTLSRLSLASIWKGVVQGEQYLFGAFAWCALGSIPPSPSIQLLPSAAVLILMNYFGQLCGDFLNAI